MEPTDLDPATVEPPLRLTTSDDGAARVIALAGELDPHTTPLLDEQINQCMTDGASQIVLDLSELRFIDSSGLRILVAAHKALDRQGGQLVLRSPNATAQRLFEITGLADHLVIEADPSGTAEARS